MVWGPLIMAGAGLAGSLIGNNSANKRARQLERSFEEIPGIGKQYLEPYINRGNQAQDIASGAYNTMLQNPTSFVEQIMASYKPSQGYDFRKKNALNAARNTAAAGGFTGTRNDQLEQAAIADGLLAQDMQQYLQNVLGVHNTGLAGTQRVADTGFGAASNLADYIGNAYGARAGLQFQHNQQRNTGMGEMFGQLQGLLGTVLGGKGGAYGGFK